MNSVNQMVQEVSSDSERLILVSSRDEDIGTMSKLDCHLDEGVLHRAFSIFVFNQSGDVLLQKRSAQKLLWPLCWSNACCSHPRYGETVDEAVHRRLQQELGIETELTFLYKFIYQESFEDVGTEHEYCWVWFGKAEEKQIAANTNEIAEWRFFPQAEFESMLQTSPEQFTPWLKMEWRRLKNDFADKIPAL